MTMHHGQRRLCAIMCFPNRDSALDGMEALHELGYRYIERVELVDEACDAHTVFVEAWTTSWPRTRRPTG